MAVMLSNVNLLPGLIHVLCVGCCS